ncbi:MAG: DUF3300 domain-containing protein [Betaproteobacteria bacterium]|nr:DUF3300 domain-containing protein [Betaproteobacteria bacterium]
MRTFYKSAITGSLALLLAASVALAQDRTAFRQEELDQMLAPVALHPDSLLSQILMAATYPLEVVQAARWLRANPGLEGQDAVTAVEPMEWDPSVKSLTAFPQILSMMDEKLDWTERLGEAFLAQQEDVMNTVQGLRRRAEAAGNLRSGDRMRVVRQGEAIVIEPPAPDVVYVPHYSPAVVYGPWWWPAYPPVYWTEPLAYYAVPAHRPAFFWGTGIVISAGFFFGHFDWPQRQVTVVHVQHRHPARIHSAWRHDPAHRRGVPFRYTAPHARFEPRGIPGARRDAVRSTVARPERHAGDNRPADIRQQRVEERRNALRERRNAQPEGRGAQGDRRARPGGPERFAQAATDRRGQLGPAPRPHAPAVLPRTTAAATVTRAVTSPVAAAPVARSERRTDTPAVGMQAATRQALERARSVPSRNGSDYSRRPDMARRITPPPRPVASGPAPRPSASAPNRASRIEDAQRRGGAQAQTSQRVAARPAATPATRPGAVQRPRPVRVPAGNRP